MVLHIVAVYDGALGAFARPIFVPSLGIAMRSFVDEVNRADSEIARHVDDYALHEIGEFDDVTGLMAQHDCPRLLAKAVTVLVKGENRVPK